MAASFELELDTRAPAITLAGAAVVNEGVSVTVAYGVDEPSLQDATLAQGGTLIVGRITSDRLIFDLDGLTFAGGRVTANAVDAVGNASQSAMDYTDGSTGVITPPVVYWESTWSGAPDEPPRRGGGGDDFERADFVIGLNRRP